MEIKVKSISDQQKKSKGRNNWFEIEMEFTGPQGDKSRVFRSFDGIFNTVKDLKIGASYDVKVVKDGDYWKWESITEIPEGAAAPAKGGQTRMAGGNDWAAKTALDRERFDFDKEKQPLIVRQSMVAAAVASLPQGASVEHILDRANAFVSFVFDDALPTNDVQQGEIE